MVKKTLLNKKKWKLLILFGAELAKLILIVTGLALVFMVYYSMMNSSKEFQKIVKEDCADDIEIINRCGCLPDSWVKKDEQQINSEIKGGGEAEYPKEWITKTTK